MSDVEIIEFGVFSSTEIPFFTMSVAAGIPVPVDTEVDSHVDLNEFLVEHPNATFFAKVRNESMLTAGIRDGDILVVDKAIQPTDGRIVVVSVNNSLTVKYYRIVGDDVYLESDNSQFIPLNFGNLIDYIILGTVTKVIHSF
ncbi:MAG: translesion error-prone DNA polymerase V autoproteolytic subunit [Candidatus Kapabacteria bacterium]|jgi:DNA polymerase V|nr:translesion error-prone DNA polymerase V autoproteolytic subunit [Candidatus Kapabacteria bacterium]